MNTPPTKVSATRLRIGVGLFVLWWLPIYLTVPAVAAVLGDSGNAVADKRIALAIIGIQTVIGLVGLLLVGKQFSLALKKVKYRQLPRTIWKILWTGHAEIPDQPKAAKKQ